jgi:poly(A) polymerase
VNIKNPERLKIISNERIKDEFCKIIISDSLLGIKLLVDTGLMNFIIPELLELRDVKQNSHHLTDVYGHTILTLKRSAGADLGEDNLTLRLLALFHDIGNPKAKTVTETGIHFYDHEEIGSKITRNILTRLKFDNDMIDRVSKLVELHMEPIVMSNNKTLTKRNVSRLLRKVPENDVKILLQQVESDLFSSVDPREDFIADLRKMIKDLRTEIPVIKSPLNGKEIMEALNIKPGKRVGEIKDRLIDLVAEGLLSLSDKEGALRIIKDLTF